MSPGEQLIFSPPRPWRDEFIDGLLAADRFQPVTYRHLTSGGATHFCWLLPAEELKSSSGSTWTPCQRGGFLYLMVGGMRPIFFELKA